MFNMKKKLKTGKRRNTIVTKFEYLDLSYGRYNKHIYRIIIILLASGQYLIPKFIDLLNKKM